MTYLLDISALIALLWDLHVHNERVTKWQTKQHLAVCPITELGFLRISAQPSLGATVQQARKLLHEWKESRCPDFVACDVEALKTIAPPTGTGTTDFYLAGLAEKHGMQLATLDQGIRHKAVFLIPMLNPSLEAADPGHSPRPDSGTPCP